MKSKNSSSFVGIFGCMKIPKRNFLHRKLSETIFLCSEMRISMSISDIVKRSDLGKMIHQMMIDTGKFDKIAADSVSIK